jgi:hypothetical protein
LTQPRLDIAVSRRRKQKTHLCGLEGGNEQAGNTTREEKAMHKQATSLRGVAVAAITAALLSLPLTSAARAQQPTVNAASQPAQQCRIVGAISHRCYDFDSDATWPDGLAGYHGSNGG